MYVLDICRISQVSFASVSVVGVRDVQRLQLERHSSSKFALTIVKRSKEFVFFFLIKGC